jgi:hypothetical protein
MQANHNTVKNRPLPAILAAAAITLMIGLAFVLLGANALLNPGIPLLQSPSDAQAAGPDNVAAATADTAGQPQELAAQFQAREQEYQAREKQYADQIKQYQSREQQLNQQLQQAVQQRDTAANQAQQYQQVLEALQQAGVIQISPNGQIFLSQPFGRHSDHD